MNSLIELIEDYKMQRHCAIKSQEALMKHLGEKYGDFIIVDIGYSNTVNRDRTVKMICYNCGKQIETKLQQSVGCNQLTRYCKCWQPKETKQKRILKPTTERERLKRIWNGMKQRCYNQKSKKYMYYGAKGIIICDEWLHCFDNFFEWSLSKGYNNNLTIDRIDNSKGYLPENCRWVTFQEQARNKDCIKKYRWNGEDLTFNQLCEKFPLASKTKMKAMLDDGCNVLQALAVALPKEEVNGKTN